MRGKIRTRVAYAAALAWALAGAVQAAGNQLMHPSPLPFQASGQLLNRVMGVFNALTSANTDPALQKVQAEEAAPLAELDNAMERARTLATPSA